MNEPQPSQRKSIGTLIAAMVLIVFLAGLLIFRATGLQQNGDEFVPSQFEEKAGENDKADTSPDKIESGDTALSVDAITQTLNITTDLSVTPEITPTLSIQLVQIEDTYNLGLQSMKAGNNEQAIAKFTQAIEENRIEPVWPYLGRASVYERLGRFEEALSDYTQALFYEPEDAKIYHSRGNTYTTIGNYEQAIEDYDKALELDLQNAKSYHNRGWVYNRQEDYIQALADFTLAIQLKHSPTIARQFL